VGEAKRKRQQKIEADNLAIRDAQQGFIQKKNAEYAAIGMKVYLDSASREKMSEILIEYASPLIHASGDDASAKKEALVIAMAIWNIALLPEDEQLERIEELVTTFQGPSTTNDDVEAYRRIIMLLLQRKEEHFSDFKRSILDINFVEITDGFHVNVVSTPPKP
jgi:hypothetical protein